MSSDPPITYKTGHERADWLSVYRDRFDFWSSKTNQDTAHENACDDADRAIQAMRDRNPRPSKEVGHG